MDEGIPKRKTLVGRNSPTSERRLRTAEKRQRALERRKAGASFDAIAQELGYANKAGAHKAVLAALDQTLREPAAEVRKLELERLDRLFLVVWPQALKGDTKAMDRCLQIAKQRASLEGLNIDKLALTDPTGEKEFGGRVFARIEQYAVEFRAAAAQHAKDVVEEQLTEEDLARAGFAPQKTGELPTPCQTQ
jgi:hypothetical protein